MVQVTVSCAQCDRGTVSLAIYNLEHFVSYRFTNTSIIVTGTGYLHLGVNIKKLQDATKGIRLQISEPEVVFLQPMMKVKIQAPVRFERDILNELTLRHLCCPPTQGLVCYQKESDWVFETRLPLLVLRHLVRTLRKIGSNEITSIFTPDGSDDITEKQLMTQLDSVYCKEK